MRWSKGKLIQLRANTWTNPYRKMPHNISTPYKCKQKKHILCVRKGLDLNSASARSKCPVPGHVTSQNFSLLICQRGGICLIHQLCRLNETMCVNCLAKSVFTPSLQPGVVGRLMMWGVSFGQFIKTTVRSMRVETVGRIFASFSVKCVWSLSIHPSFTLFIHICVHSFIHLFIQPFLKSSILQCARCCWCRDGFVWNL